MNLRTCLAVVLGIGIGALFFRTSNAPAPAPPPSQDELKLSLSENDLAELESRGDLASKLRVWQTAEGWRIELFSPDSLLERVGLRSGDVITFASLRRQLDDPDRRNLAGRMTALLDHLAQ